MLASGDGNERSRSPEPGIRWKAPFGCVVFGVVAGTGRLLQELRAFRFGDDELRYLRDNRVVGAETLRYLENYRFTGSIRGYREGVVRLSMQGACSGCPSSTATLKLGIENMLRHFVPEVVSVEQVMY